MGSGSRWRCSLLLRAIVYVTIFGALVLIAVVVLQIVAGYRRRFIVQTEERVESLYLAVRPERIWLWSLLCATGVALLVGLVSGFRPVLAVAGAIAGFMAPRLYLSFMERRRRRKFDAQLLDAIRIVASAMKAGMSLMQAMAHVTREMGPPIRQEFAHALQENQVGKPIIQALHDMKKRIRSDDLAITVNAMGIAIETGGVLSDLLLKMADTIRARNLVRGRINTLSAQGKLQGIVMILVPWVMGLALNVLDPDMMRPMYTTTIGQVTLVIIVAIEFVGWLVIRRLVAIDV